MASESSSATAPRFFLLQKLLAGHHDTVFSSVDPALGPPISCPQCKDTVGMLTWQPPYRVKLDLYGRDYGDLVDGPGGNLLATERFASAFQADGLTGLSGFHPVEVVRVRRQRRGPKPGPPPKYLLVLPAYGSAAVDEARSRLRRTRPIQCSYCRSTGVDAIDGFTLEAGSWNGDDIFRPRGLWGCLVVSERFVRFAEKFALSHMSMIPTELYVWDPLGRYSPDGPPAKNARA